MLQRLCCAALLGSLRLTASVSAQAEAPPVSAQAEVPSKLAATPEVRRDPRGIKGISPFSEALERGDRAVLAQDLESAIVAYREASSKEPENALGHYRLAEAQILKGELREAQLALLAGLRCVGEANPGLKAKLHFVLADVLERQSAYEEASAQWTEYEMFSNRQPGAHGFPTSGSERKKVLEAWQKLSRASLEVRARIEKRLQAAEEAVPKKSK